MVWTPYNACCREAAKQPTFALCDDCGHKLLRCMAHENCGSLVEPKGHCPMCLQPQLSLDGRDMATPIVGDRMALSFVLTNPKNALRAIHCKRAAVRAISP